MELLLDDIICYMMFWSLILVEAIPKLFYMVNEMMKFIKYEQIWIVLCINTWIGFIRLCMNKFMT